MARKLYIFNPSGRVKSGAQLPARWVGGYTDNYTYLGDYQARLLGAGHPLTVRRLVPWVHAPTVGLKFSKGGASRFDGDFRGWG